MRRETRAKRHARAVHNAKILSSVGLGPKTVNITRHGTITGGPPPLPPLVSVKFVYFVTVSTRSVYMFRQAVGSSSFEGLKKSETWDSVPVVHGQVVWVGWDYKSGRQAAQAAYYTVG